jgi:peroxiredoxin
MKKLALLFLSVAMANALAATHLKVGDKAPNISLSATTGGTVSLSDYLGKQMVVVGFFPAAFTGG